MNKLLNTDSEVPSFHFYQVGLQQSLNLLLTQLNGFSFLCQYVVTITVHQIVLSVKLINRFLRVFFLGSYSSYGASQVRHWLCLCL